VSKTYPPSSEFSSKALVKSMDEYKKLYDESIKDPDAFWAKIAERLHWFKKWDTVREYDFVNANIAWYKGGKLNISYNCLDRHVEAGKGNNTAIIWEGNEPSESKTFTYA
jgi:acetyl-CoA synthetase